MRRILRTVATVISISAALGAAGCGSGGDATKPEPAGGAAASGGGTPSIAKNAPGRCGTGDLKADVQIQKAGSALLAVTNTGKRSCTVKGYPGFGGLGADNSAVDLKTDRKPHPGPPERITLKPGASAFAGLRWKDCDKAKSSCVVVSGLRMTPPDETKALTAKVLGLDGKTAPQLTLDGGRLTVGTLQPASQGVLFP